MSSLRCVELGVLGPLQVRQDGAPILVPGSKPRAILTMLGLRNGSVVPADTLVELLWTDDPPRTAAKALQTHISALRRALGDGVVVTEGTGWTLRGPEVDASRYKTAAKMGREAAAAGDTSQAVARFEEALTLWRGIPELPDGQRGLSEKTRWIEGHAALVEDRADALLATGRAAEVIGDLEAAVAEAPLRERRWGQLMLALYRAGRQGEALGAYQRARSHLVDELGVDPGPELRRLEAAIVAQDSALDVLVEQQLPSVTRAVTFLLTDIEGSTAAWENDADAMAVALARHDEIVEQVVTSRGGRLIKTRGEGDATFSVFERPSASAAAALELQDAISHEPWALGEPMRIRIALHTGEVELRDGDYFGRAVNRAARLRSLADGGQILCSGATAELVIDSLSDDVVLTDLGMRQLKNLARAEHVFELRLETEEDGPAPQTNAEPLERPSLPAVLIGAGPFVGRGDELERLLFAWQTALAGGVRPVLIAGEPGVGKTRLAGEWSQQAYGQGAAVLYGRCDEDLGAPYQPFAEALRSLVPCIGADRLRGLRGVEALLPLVPGLTDVLPDLAAPTSADPDTERYALFDAVVAVFEIASAGAPVVLVLDDLHWAGKPTLLLLRHLLRFGEHARMQIVGTYRNTDLDRSHPLAAMLADLHRDGTANRINLSGLDDDDVTAYVAEAGYDDEELAHALASVTGGNPFFLIEALRHVDESGGVWDQSTLPQGVREAVSRRLSRLPAETNKALAAAAVVGARFAVELVESVVGNDLIDAFDEASKAGIIIEEPGGHYRFNHALVRQSLLAELASVRRMRLHQRIATTLESQPGADDELLAELAHHYFECAWAGNAAKAVEYCRRAADQAMARLAYEGAADLYDHALHALEEIDDELPDRDDQAAELLVARCEALLAAGDVASAAGAVTQLQAATVHSARLAAWGTCFDGQLSMLTHPERLAEIETALGAAAEKLGRLDDAAGEAKAHTVRAASLARLGRIGDCEVALDDALTAARRAREHRRVNAVLAGAPLAALWGPNPVPRAGGRCLDVVRLLRITTDSPAVEATSTRCQAVLESFRGRSAPARRMIDSARRTVTELGLRHALLEVEQFAGIVELVADDPAAAEPHLRKAYNGFRRMGLDADTAETAALLGRACLALDRDADADELCTESERLAGDALKPSIAWRTLRAQLLARRSDHREARQVAEAAVALAERTDLLVDHGDACLALAIVLEAAGSAAGARAAAERAANLYEQKGAAALADKARRILGERDLPSVPAPPERPPVIELNTACVRAGERVAAAVNRGDWDEYERLFAPGASIESRRKIVGFTPIDIPFDDLQRENRRILETGEMHLDYVFIAVRGERLALSRLKVATDDASPGAPIDEFLQVYGIDDEGRVALQIWFDPEDIDAALAELDAAHARLEESSRASGAELDNACVQMGHQLIAAVHREAWDEVVQLFAPYVSIESHRKIVGFPRTTIPSAEWPDGMRRFLRSGMVRYRPEAVAVRGERLAVMRLKVGTADTSPGAPQDEMVQLVGLDEEGRIELEVSYDIEDVDAALAELDAVHARFEEPQPQARRLENAASRVNARYVACVNARDWDSVASILHADHYSDDRRRVTGAGTRRGRDAEIENVRVIANLGATMTAEVIATRGDRLILTRTRASFEQQQGFLAEVFLLVETDLGGRIAATIMLDLDDFPAALDELDARYIAGEAAPYARTWSAIARSYATITGGELAATTPDWVNIDHRRAAAFAPGEANEYIRAAWDLTQNLSIYVEAVHQLNDLGAVVTHATRGTSRQDFDAEWRATNLFTVDGDLISRTEMFDEADLDVAIARFEELSKPAPQLENSASRANARFIACVNARDWDAGASLLADDHLSDDRRRVTGGGTRRGRDAEIENWRAITDLGAIVTVEVIATRGDHLILTRNHVSFDQQQQGFLAEILGIIETDFNGRIAAAIVLDLEDIEAAFEELDARYLAGEAAAHARTWTVIERSYAAFNRHELPPQDWVSIDHRRGTPFAASELTATTRELWDLTPDLAIDIVAVHRLSDIGAVVTHAGHGSSQDGFDAEWRAVDLLTVDGELINRTEVFDEADLNAAIAQFEELSKPVPELENTASRANARFVAYLNARDWDAIVSILADDHYSDDQRRVTGTGILRGREAEIENLRVTADLGATMTFEVIATRGDRLALTRTRASFDQQQGFLAEVLLLVGTDLDGRITATVILDLEDIEAAFEELDARYLAGEAAPYARTWSAVAGAYAGFNRRELLPTTPDWVNIDHRRGAAFAPGDMIAYIQAAWNDSPDTKIYVGAVHRLSKIGAVVTHLARGISQEGFDAEWRDVHVLAVEGDMVSRSEIYDEADLDAAIARFEELQPQSRQLENSASHVYERVQAWFTARDWAALSAILADNTLMDDRRRVVGAGVRRGRNDTMAGWRSIADIGATDVTSVPIATRGTRLALCRTRVETSGEFDVEALQIVEIDADERMVALVSFGLDDFDAAIAELETRYLAGEAAAYTRTWPVIASVYAALSRGEFPATAPDLVNIDHRGEVAFGPGDLITYLRSGLELDQGIKIYVEAVHRLTDFGAAITYAADENSREGLDAEWRGVSLLTVESDTVNRCEVFDEEDLGAALARFDELSPRTPRLENAASQAYERMQACFATRDWDAMAEMLADDAVNDDRRRVVGAGLRHGPGAVITEMSALAEIGVKVIVSDSIATRGRHIVLSRSHAAGRDQRPDAFRTDVLNVVQINADERIAALVIFDPDDFDAALVELDARYLAGEAAAHPHAWSAITQAYAVLNQGEIPTTTTNMAEIDHRPLTAIGPGDLKAYIRATFDDSTENVVYIETVHRLTNLGVVVTNVAKGTTREGFYAEWRMVLLMTVDGGLVSRGEIFDEADLDAALARFEELSLHTPRLENTASRADELFAAYFGARNWAAVAEILADDSFVDDRRRVVNAGFWEGRDGVIANMRALAVDGGAITTSTVIATRGERVALARIRSSNRDLGHGEFAVELLSITEIDTDERIVARVVFDPDDFDAAFAELDARYLAGEAAPYAATWSVITRAYAALVLRRELPPTTPDWVNIDHRRGISFAPGDMTAFIRDGLDTQQDMSSHIEAVHRLNNLGAVFVQGVKATSQEGFEAEWRIVELMTTEGDLISGTEVFDEADLDAALARFDELQPQAPRLQNAASKVLERFLAHFAPREWEAMSEMLADNSFTDDRRRLLGVGPRHDREVIIADWRAVAGVGTKTATATVIATRGDRLALCRLRFSGRDQRPDAFRADVLGIVETNADDRIAVSLMFDLDDIDAAFEELDSRYLAGEAAAHAQTWSVIAALYAGFNRHKRPGMTPDFIYVDHRPVVTIEANDLTASIEAYWDLTPDIRASTDAVHRLSDLGAVITNAARGISHEDFDAESRMIAIFTVDGDLISRCEMFDEADLDAALARFDELHVKPQPM